MGKRRGKTAGNGSVRIIAGQWRGRQLAVPDLPGLRPTSDRSRETLFNWLQPWLEQARCADLFAGSGALGFEAASRGAAKVEMVELLPLAVSGLQTSRTQLNAEQVQVYHANALDWLTQAGDGPFDILFVDPPFDSGLAVQVLGRIQQLDCMANGGLVYAESPSQFPELVMAAPFVSYRSKVVGNSRLQLFRREE